MAVIITIVCVCLLGILVSETANGSKRSKTKAKGVWALLLVLLYFPIGVIMALTKNYK